MTSPSGESTADARSTLLRIEGREALPLLHRLSTQQLADLAPGEARVTLLCDFRGRLLHRAMACATGDGALWLLRDDAPGGPLAAYLDRHVFREDVRIADLSAAWEVQIAPSDAKPGVVERDGRPETVRAGDWALRVRPSGSAASFDPDLAAAAERSRIRTGRPRQGHEIREEFTPFEVGLDHEVQFNKGCFTGQEALLRLVTRRSVRRRMAWLEGRGRPAAPSEVWCAGQPIGCLTSAAAAGPEEPGRWVGLAVLRVDAEPELGLTVEGAESVEAPRFVPATEPVGR